MGVGCVYAAWWWWLQSKPCGRRRCVVSRTTNPYPVAVYPNFSESASASEFRCRRRHSADVPVCLGRSLVTADGRLHFPLIRAFSYSFGISPRIFSFLTPLDPRAVCNSMSVLRGLLSQTSTDILLESGSHVLFALSSSCAQHFFQVLLRRLSRQLDRVFQVLTWH